METPRLVTPSAITWAPCLITGELLLLFGIHQTLRRAPKLPLCVVAALKLKLSVVVTRCVNKAKARYLAICGGLLVEAAVLTSRKA